MLRSVRINTGAIQKPSGSILGNFGHRRCPFFTHEMFEIFVSEADSALLEPDRWCHVDTDINKCRLRSGEDTGEVG
uniref:Uncharacterized protein n=1 Tax=Desulfovibrio sp. U5L TaxID=596152 RepID=I2PZG2_9BACT